MRRHERIRGFTLACLVITSAATSLASAQEDPLRVVAEQAAILDAAPRLSSGRLDLGAGALDAGAFVWIEVEQAALYTLSLSTPGALVLGSFPTPDGAYDGQTSPERHASALSQNEAPTLGPLLLTPAHPYLLSVSSKAGPATLTLSPEDPGAAPRQGREEETAVADGDTLYVLDGRLDLTLAGATTARRLEVLAEPRASLKTRLGGEAVPAGGIYPWLSSEDTLLRLAGSVGGGELPRVLVRLSPDSTGLDDTEPNADPAAALPLGEAISGHLLRYDEDHWGITLEQDRQLALSFDSDNRRARYSARLLRLGDGQERTLWTRERTGSLTDEALLLPAGDYRLEFERKDGDDAPAPYTLSLAGDEAPGDNREVEPNDTAASAMPLPSALRVSGSAGEDDVDTYLLSVPVDKAEHLWRVFTVNAGRIRLADDDGTFVDVRATGRRSMADALALSPGEYLVTINAEGDYLLRVADLGPRPSDYEGEPNDSVADGQRMMIGEGIRGGFHREDDQDYYLFRVDAPAPLEIEIRPVDDGPMDVKLYHGGSQVGKAAAFDAGSGSYVFRSTLPPGDWSLLVRSQGAAIQGSYEVVVRRLAHLTGNEPDDDPLDAVKLPRDGRMADSVGAFDGTDQVFVPLPEGEGQAAMICRHPPGASPARQRLKNWSDGGRVADIRDGIGLFDYTPTLGGALQFELSGNSASIPYECALRFPPLGPPPPPVDSGPASPGTPGEADPVILAPGETRSLTLAEEGDEPSFSLDLEPEEMAFAACRTAGGEPLPPSSRVWQSDGVRHPANRDLLGELQPLVAEAEPVIRLRRTYAQRFGEGTLPLTVHCTLWGVDDLPGPSDMGPAAEFVVFEAADDPGRPEDQSASGQRTPGPPPPGLEALLGRETPERQAEGDLPVTITVAPFPDVAAFSEAGQSLPVSARFKNEAKTALDLEVTLEVSGDGWRVEPAGQTLRLTPEGEGTLSARLVAPPWLTPSLRPSLVVRAEAGNAFSAELAPLPVSVSAIPSGPFTYWHAPDALRGGLNVLHFGLGARLVRWGDTVPDDNIQSRESALHDGIALHTGAPNLPRDVAIRLASTAEVAGVMIQLRSTDNPAVWPAEMEIYVPQGDSGWRRVAAASLESRHSPQYLVFDQPVRTDRLRFVFPRCLSACKQVWVQELQAIATPGTHPEDLPPINAADPALGGHVVWSTERFGGYWNSEFLVGEASRSNGGWPGRRKDHAAQMTVAFHQNRAALIDSIVWVGDPDDTARYADGLVEAGMDGPGGPWTTLGRLHSPPIGETRAALTLDDPTWARYLRFTFDVSGEVVQFGPDAIEVLETPGTSVLGLWEDDSPRAAWEATTGAEPTAPVSPAGGADRDRAVALPFATPVASSVVIERNEDWWRFTVPEGPARLLGLDFKRQRPLVVTELYDSAHNAVSLEETGGGGRLEAVLFPGSYTLRVFEPPRSVVISWDTSGSVSSYIPRTLAAVRTWGRGLQPGRDALQLLPFGGIGFLLEDWAETPEALEPALADLPTAGSSASEEALETAALALADRRGARGVVIMTDAETGMNTELWPALLDSMPRVVSLSVDSSARQNAAVMMDWAALNGGRFQRVIGPLGLADSMEMANALFRAPKAYGLTASLEELVEAEGDAELTLAPAAGVGTAATGAVELILDASGSMLQRMEGRRRIDIAHEALTGLVRDTLPEGTPFAFRAFGLEEDACRSELMVPLAPLDREAAATAIESVPAINLAKTAIADSLRAAGQDLADARPPRVVVLVTDGEETCEGDPEAAIAGLRASGLDARVNIVGFAIDDAALAETFAAWAEAGGGAYFDASGAEALERSIADALRPGFDITRNFLDGRREVVGRALLGETLTVPAGRLTVTPGSGATGEPITLQVEARDMITVEYDPGAGLSRSATDE